jgi:disintegrin and metalloproteinase domain-containing protein 10
MSKKLIKKNFTNRNGALGLAYLASSTGAGGICQKNTVVNDVAKSLNTGVVTILNYGTRVADLLVQISFLHEVGHSFGSMHDPASCQPGSKNGGNYIMYFSATSGAQANNIVYSPCSLSQIGSVLNFIVQNRFCFICTYI